MRQGHAGQVQGDWGLCSSWRSMTHPCQVHDGCLQVFPVHSSVCLGCRMPNKQTALEQLPQSLHACLCTPRSCPGQCSEGSSGCWRAGTAMVSPTLRGVPGALSNIKQRPAEVRACPCQKFQLSSRAVRDARNRQFTGRPRLQDYPACSRRDTSGWQPRCFLPVNDV